MGWSLESLFRGRHPSQRHDGLPFGISREFIGDSARRDKVDLALPCKAACIQVKGDWAWFKQAFQLTGWKGETKDKRCCWVCPANTLDMDFRRCDSEAKWRGKEFTQMQFVMQNIMLARFRSALFAFPGMQLKYLSIDLMHASCLGILQYLLGNVFFELSCSLGGNLTGDSDKTIHAMKMLMLQIRIAAKTLGIPVPIQYLSFAMIKAQGKGPKMKLKAAEGRYMLQILRVMLRDFHSPPRTPRETTRFACVGYLAQVYDELPVWDPDGSPDAIRMAGLRHITLYQELFRYAASRDRDTIYWRIYPKHHIFVHLVEKQTAEQGSPSEGWNYSDEAEIGKAVDVACSTHCLTICRELIRKYRAVDLALLVKKVRSSWEDALL